MKKPPLKRTTFLLMSLFAGLTLAACHPYQIGYNGKLGAGAFNLNAGSGTGGYSPSGSGVGTGGSSGGSDSSGTGTGTGGDSGAATQPSTTNNPKDLDQVPITPPPLTTSQGSSSTSPYQYLIKATQDTDVIAEFNKDLQTANQAVGQAYGISNRAVNTSARAEDNSNPSKAQSFFFGVTGQIDGHGKALDFEVSNAQYYKPTEPHQDPNQPITTNLIVAGDVTNAPSLTIGQYLKAKFFGGSVAPNTTISKDASLSGATTFKGDLTNNGKLFTYPRLSTEPNKIDTEVPHFENTSPKFVDLGKGKILLVGTVSYKVEGNFTQSTTGSYYSLGGVIRVNGNAQVDGTLFNMFLPNDSGIRKLLLVSPNPINVASTVTSSLFLNEPGYRIQSFLKPEVIEFSIGEGSQKTKFYGLTIYPGGAPADKITQAGFEDTYTNNLGQAPCILACAHDESTQASTTKNDEVNTDDALIAALPKKPDNKMQSGYLKGFATPTFIFTKEITGSSDVNFATVDEGQASIVFNNTVSLGTLTINPNTKVILNGTTLSGNVTLTPIAENPKAKPSELIAHGTVTGDINNQNGIVTVVQHPQNLILLSYGQTISPAVYILHGVSKGYDPNKALSIVSFPVGLIVNGNYTQVAKKLAYPNLKLNSGIMFVKGEVNIPSGAIIYGYKPNVVQASNLLIVSNNPIKMGDDVLYGHVVKGKFQADSKPVTVKFAENLFGLINQFVPTSSEGNGSGDANGAGTRSVRTQGVSHKATHSALRAALANVKTPEINVKVVDSQGRATGKTVRLAGSNSLLELRAALDAGKVSKLDQDMLDGNPLVRMQQANAATRLFLNNNNLFGLLDGVNTKPAKGSKLSVQVGLDNDVLFGGKHRLANASVLHVAVASGPVVGRVALNYVGLRQNITNRDNVKSGELSHSSGYGVNLGAQMQLPQSGGYGVAINVGFEAFNNKLNLMSGIEPKYNTSAFSATLLGSKDLVLGNLQAKNDLLTVTPFVGYRFARQHNDQFSLNKTVNGNSYKVTVAKQSLMSNSLVAGASVKYQNAFGVQGLELGAQLAADMALNGKASYDLGLEGFSNAMNNSYSVDAKGNNAFTAQGLLRVGYQLNNLQFGARVQLQVNDVVEGSVGGFASVSF